ncbi:major facilitator superfamily domain-containing protein [Auriculariales sp. MPI-PUGE-AT-0066]|nr:major facilitator superfamily domain-containing protein [Auriculariales sp. MPI-PUGE-AT-0066]
MPEQFSQDEQFEKGEIKGSVHTKTSDEEIGASIKPADDYPEGGLSAWMTVAGSWLVLVVAIGLGNSFGAFQDYYARKYLLNSTISDLGWIESVQSGLLYAVGPFVGVLFDRGYFFSILIFGVTVYSFSMFMLSLIFLAFGLGSGIGIGCLLLPSISLIGQYFSRRRPLASGIAFTGASFGGIVIAQLVNHLLDDHSLGYANGSRVVAAVTTACVLGGMALMRPRGDIKRAPSQGNHQGSAICRVWGYAKEGEFVWICVGLFIMNLAIFYPLFYLQLYASLRDVPASVTLNVVTIMNATAIPGRLVPNVLSQRFGILNTLIFNALACCAIIIGILGIGYGSDAGPSIIAVATLYGFISGGMLAQMTPVLASTARNVHEIGTRTGLGFVGIGIGNLLGPPIMGWILTNEYMWWRVTIFSGIIAVMAMLNTLPHELLLTIFTGVSVHDLRTLRLTSTFWNSFVHQYSNALFRNAAIAHDYISTSALDGDPNARLQEAAKWHAIMDLSELVTGWEELCKRFASLDHSWNGMWRPGLGHLPRQLTLRSTGNRVHRFKIVSDEQLAIVTMKRPDVLFAWNLPGTLIVADLHTDEVLWALPSTHVRMYAHVEYSCGYLVFDRGGDALEVWRRATDVERKPLNPIAVLSQPDSFMFRAAAEASIRAEARTEHSLVPDLRGRFVPHALLRTPVAGYAYHLVGTHLVVASQAALCAFIYDVETGELLDDVALDCHRGYAPDWDELRYIEVDPARRRVFVSTEHGVYVYANEDVEVADDESDGVSDDGDRDLSRPTSWVQQSVFVTRLPTAEACVGASAYSLPWFPRPSDTWELDPPFKPIAVPRLLTIDFSWSASDSEINAAHVSPDGRDMVMLSDHSIIIMCDFEHPRPENTRFLRLHRVDLHLVDNEYLAFDGRRIVVGTSDGILIMDVRLENVVWLRPHAPQQHRFSCVQVTREAAWATWGEGMLQDAAPASLMGFDFSRPPDESG